MLINPMFKLLFWLLLGSILILLFFKNLNLLGRKLGLDILESKLISGEILGLKLRLRLELALEFTL